MRYLLSLVAALMLSLPGQAQPVNIEARVRETLSQHLPEIRALRHTFHREPELGNREFKTAARVARYLRKLGLKPKTQVAHTGVVAHIDMARPGPHLLLRADMDALPIEERSGLPFASRRVASHGTLGGQAQRCQPRVRS